MEVQEIHLLMVDYFAGRAGKEETERLMAWVALAPENEQEFSRMKAIWEASAHAMDAEDIKQALKRTKHKIALATSATETAPTVKVLRLKWWRSVAAILLLSLGAFWGYQQFVKEVYLTKITADNIDSLLLADGSKIYLSSNTRFSYPEKMNGKNREVRLLNGEAFFKVAKDSLRPFTVVLNNSKVTVLGTSFNIRNTPRAVDLSVNTGKVAFEAISGNDKAILTAGMGLNYNISANTIMRFSSVNQNNLYWLNKELVFVNASLDKVFESLENCYGVKIKLKDTIPSQQKFNAEFKDDSIEEVLEVLKTTYPIKFQVHGREIIVNHK